MDMAKSFFGRDHEGYVGKKDHAVGDCKLVKTIVHMNTHSIGKLLIFLCGNFIIVADNGNSWLGR